MTAAELHALLLLAGARDPLGGGAVQLPIRELARAMGVNASTASRRLARLRRLGLVRAWSDPTHRQASAYTLTRLDAAPAASSEERA